MADRVIGPALPPNFSRDSLNRRSSSDSGTNDSDTDSSSSRASNSDSDSDRESQESCKQSVMGSTHTNSRDTSAVIGPLMPPGFSTGDPCRAGLEAHGSIGPVLPPGFPAQYSPDLRPVDTGPNSPPGLTQTGAPSSDEEDTGFGPRLPAPGLGKSAAEEFEERSSRMKHKLLHGVEEEAPRRESWMTELPTVRLRKEMGLQARKLGAGSTVKYEDQSVWTDTPADRQRKQQEALEGRGVKRSVEEPIQSARDRELAEQVQHHNKKQRAVSLIDMHRKKLQKKKKMKDKEKKKKEKKKKKKSKTEKSKSSDTKPQRKPFNREDDLNVSRFDNAQRKALIKKSRELNTKFSSGGSQFL